MPIYEFACPKCRVIFSFFSKRINPDRSPVCPRCGNKKLSKEMSRFAALSGGKKDDAPDSPVAMPNLDDPKIARAMGQLERDMAGLDENNPKQMAHLMRKMNDLMPAGTLPKEFETALKRLEAGEDPDKIEADMGDLLGEALGGGPDQTASGKYERDGELYDY